MSTSHEYLGWVTGRQATMFNGEVWHSDPGYNLIFALCRLPSSKVLQFETETVQLQLTSGAVVRPLGVALSLDETFTCAKGQKSPMVLPSKQFSWRQDSGSCYALVFSLWAGDTPKAFSLNGRSIDAGPMLRREPAPNSPGGPDRTQGQALSSISITDGLCFCYRSDVPMPITGFRPPQPSNGIVLVVNCGDTSVVVVRVPPELLSNGKSVTESGIVAKLRDGTVATPHGLVLKTGMRESPYGCADRYRVSVQEKTLSAGGKLTFMHNYPGPFSIFTAEECKLGFAFPSNVNWESIQSISMPGFETTFPNGTAVLDL